MFFTAQRRVSNASFGLGPQIESIWFAKDMESLDRPERRELVKTEREASPCVSRLKRAKPFAKAIAEVSYMLFVVYIGFDRRQSRVVQSQQLDTI